MNRCFDHKHRPGSKREDNVGRVFETLAVKNRSEEHVRGASSQRLEGRVLFSSLADHFGVPKKRILDVEQRKQNVGTHNT